MILHHCSTVMTQGRLKVFMTAVRSVNYFFNYFYFGEGERRKAGRTEGEKDRGSVLGRTEGGGDEEGRLLLLGTSSSGSGL